MNEPVRVVDRGRFAVVHLDGQDALFMGNHASMRSLWSSLEELGAPKRVVLVHLPLDHLAPRHLDAFWDDVSEAPAQPSLFGSPRPLALNTAHAAVQRMIRFAHGSRSMVAVAFSGEVDFDLFGLLLAAQYRICTPDTVFVNRTLERNTTPGSATMWFLARHLGYGKARKLFLDQTSLDATQALDLGLVDEVVPSAELQSAAEERAASFADCSPVALRSLLKSLDLLSLDLFTYLDQAGTGFEDLPKT